MEWLRQDIDILHLKEIPIDRIHDIHGRLIQIYDIQSEEYLAGLSDDMFFLFTVDMHAIDIDHNPFPIDVVMLFCCLAFLFYDILEILIREFLVERLENIESEEGESAFIKHEVVCVFGIFPGFVGYLSQILVEDILQNLFAWANLVDTETRVRLWKMLVSYIKQNRWFTK